MIVIEVAWMNEWNEFVLKALSCYIMHLQLKFY